MQRRQGTGGVGGGTSETNCNGQSSLRTHLAQRCELIHGRVRSSPQLGLHGRLQHLLRVALGSATHGGGEPLLGDGALQCVRFPAPGSHVTGTAVAASRRAIGTPGTGRRWVGGAGVVAHRTRPEGPLSAPGTPLPAVTDGTVVAGHGGMALGQHALEAWNLHERGVCASVRPRLCLLILHRHNSRFPPLKQSL